MLAGQVVASIGRDLHAELGQHVGPHLDRLFRVHLFAAGVLDRNTELIVPLVDQVGQHKIGRGDAILGGDDALAEDLVALGVLDQEIDGRAAGGRQVEDAEGQRAHVDGLARLVEGLVAAQQQAVVALDGQGLFQAVLSGLRTRLDD